MRGFSRSTGTTRRRLAIVALLFGAVFIGACGTSETTPPDVGNPYGDAVIGTDATLEVVTWNLETYAKNGDTTVDLVKLAIQGMDADVIALQEIQYYPAFRDLHEGLLDWDGYKATSDSYMNLAFLYKTDGLLEVTAIYEILTDYSREFPRTPLVLEGTFNGTPFLVINNHLKCCGNNELEEDDPWDEETRRRDANLLLQQYVADNYAGQRVVIVGDFNDEVTDSGTANVFANFLDASHDWRIADMDIARDTNALWSYPGWPSHLDHILITSPLFAALDGAEAAVRVIPLHEFSSGGWGGYDRDISDHLPVALRLTP